MSVNINEQKDKEWMRLKPKNNDLHLGLCADNSLRYQASSTATLNMDDPSDPQATDIPHRKEECLDDGIASTKQLLLGKSKRKDENDSSRYMQMQTNLTTAVIVLVVLQSHHLDSNFIAFQIALPDVSKTSRSDWKSAF